MSRNSIILLSTAMLLATTVTGAFAGVVVGASVATPLPQLASQATLIIPKLFAGKRIAPPWPRSCRPHLLELLRSRRRPPKRTTTATSSPYSTITASPSPSREIPIRMVPTNPRYLVEGPSGSKMELEGITKMAISDLARPTERPPR